MARDRPQYLKEMLSPLSLAALVAIAVVWYTGAESLAARDPALAWPARSAVLIFLLGFLGVMWPADSPRRYWLCVLAMSGSAFGLLLLGPSGASSILLVLLAAVLAAQLNSRGLALALLTINLLLAVIMRWRWGAGWESTIANVAGMASFQVFAAMVMRYAARAEAMAQALQRSNADLLATRSLLAQTARDAERLRLSRELHDVAGHKLTALKLNLAALVREASCAGEPRVALCAQLADELLADIRSVVQQMRVDEGIDLSQALRVLAAPFPRPLVAIEISSDARASRVEHAEAVLRAVQEALTNCARHSQAQHLWVVLQREGGRLHLDIRDDGRGQGPLAAGNGLTGMRERLLALGGTLEIGRTDTGGVHLQAWLPEAA